MFSIFRLPLLVAFSGIRNTYSIIIITISILHRQISLWAQTNANCGFGEFNIPYGIGQDKSLHKPTGQESKHRLPGSDVRNPAVIIIVIVGCMHSHRVMPRSVVVLSCGCGRIIGVDFVRVCSLLHFQKLHTSSEH